MHNPLEWRSPEQYLPERFDPSSELYLTPAGKKRHPMSYSPFLGGKRACLGQTFAKSIMKLMVVSFVTQLDFDFADPACEREKAPNTFFH